MGKKKKAVAAPEEPKPLWSDWGPERWGTLYSNEKGSISCPDHRPAEGFDTWRLDGWRKLTGEEVEALERELGHRPVCETCAAVECREAAERATEEEDAVSADAADAQHAGDEASAPEAPAEPKKKGRRTKADVRARSTEMKTEKAPTPVWNERGQIGCTLAGHAPHKGSDTWRFEHWKKIPPGTLKEDGAPIVCETCARGGAAPVEPVPEPELVPDAPKKKSKKDYATLAYLADRYLANMERAGKSDGTCLSYKLELATAMDELGADTLLSDLTPEKVALVWAEGAKLIEKAPLPESLATH